MCVWCTYVYCGHACVARICGCVYRLEVNIRHLHWSLSTLSIKAGSLNGTPELTDSTRLASQGVLDSSVSASWALGLQATAIAVSLFTWVLWIWTPVPTLGSKHFIHWSTFSRVLRGVWEGKLAWLLFLSEIRVTHFIFLAQRLRAHTAFPRHPSLTPSTHARVLTWGSGNLTPRASAGIYTQVHITAHRHFLS